MSEKAYSPEKVETHEEAELRIAKDTLLAVVDIATVALENEEAAKIERKHRQQDVYEAMNNASPEVLESLSLDERSSLQISLSGFVPQIESNQVH